MLLKFYVLLSFAANIVFGTTYMCGGTAANNSECYFDFSINNVHFSQRTHWDDTLLVRGVTYQIQQQVINHQIKVIVNVVQNQHHLLYQLFHIMQLT